MEPEKQKPLRAYERKAALLQATTSMAINRIAEECDISKQAFWKLRKRPDYIALVAEYGQEADDEAARYQFSHRRERIRTLNQQLVDQETIIAERKNDAITRFPRIPGAKTGRIIEQEKMIGIGKNAKLITEYVYDRALDQEQRASLQALAKERGEYMEKRELSGPGGSAMMTILEVEVHKQMSPPEDDDNDV